MRAIARYIADSKGAAAVEFVLVIIPFFVLVFAIIWMGILLYSDNELQHTTEAAARCWSVGTCPAADGSDAKTYASDHYKGLGSPTFTVPTLAGTGCAHQVKGSVKIPINVVLFSQDVELDSIACFP